MKFKIKHDIPGRLRLTISGLRKNRIMARELEAHFNSFAAITTTPRLSSGSLILSYQTGTLTSSELINHLETFDSKVPVIMNNTAMEVDGEACDLVCSRCRPDSSELPSLTRQAIGVIALTGYVAYVLVRKLIFKKTVAEGALSLTSAVALAGAIPLLKDALEDLRSGRHKSLFPFLAGTCILAIFLGQALTALEVIWILRVGMLLEDYVSRRSHRAIREILELTEKNTFILVDGMEVEISVAEVQVGSIVVCHTGEKIAVDGEIIHGDAMVDESPVTGRAELETRRTGDQVYAGTIVCQGAIHIRADKVGDETYLCRILHLVERSLANQAPAEKRADELANRLMKLGSIAVAGTFLLTMSPVRAFTVLLVLACPCATVLAASTAVSAALANAARNHILIKGGYYLEQIGEADCFCFDKTGTLTVETPSLVNIFPRTPKLDPNKVLALAAGAEKHTQHPMARAVVSAAEERQIDIPNHAECHFTIGRGVRALIDDHEVLVGNDKWMRDNDIDIKYFNKRAEEQLDLGYTLIYVARDGKAQGLISVANPIRPKAEPVIAWLRENGVGELHLVTGDTERMAKAIADKFEFDSWQAELLPEEKADYVRKLNQSNHKIVMVGDGVNDALALTEARVGIAMGAGGAEVAIEAADIALADSALVRLVKLRQLSQHTINTIEQNHQLAMWTNLGGSILGAAGLMTPLMAGALHIVHTLGIVMNSSRLLNWEAPGIDFDEEEIEDTDDGN